MIPLRRLGTAVLVLAALGACGGAGVPADPQPSASPAASPTASAAPTTDATAATAATGSITFTVASGSKAVVRVNEQLADRQLPSDAVLTSDKVSGEFTLLPDGTFAPGSKITVDLTALASDNSLRDNTVKRAVLQTSQYPQATFVPTKATGLTQPLPAAGDLDFTVVGRMTVHGVTSEMTFDVTGKRAGSDLRATATARPFPFSTFGMSQPKVFTVISIKDQIRLEVDLVATQRS